MMDNTEELKKKLQWLHDLKRKCLHIDSMIDQIVGKRECDLSEEEQEFLAHVAVDHVEDTGIGPIGDGTIEHCLSSYIFFYFEDLEEYISDETELMCMIVHGLNVNINFCWNTKDPDNPLEAYNKKMKFYRPQNPIKTIVYRITLLENEILNRMENR